MATTRTQMGALIFGIFGLILVSPIPRAVLDRTTPSQMTDNPYAGMFGNAYVATGYMLLPWVRILGFALLALAATTMMVKGRNFTYRTHLSSQAANNAVGAGFGILFILFMAMSPPHLMPNRDEVAAVDAKLSGRPVPTMKARETTVGSQTFPANGTVQWGDQGQPIGGNLGRLDIWDVTGSPENKVVKIRSGLVMEMPGVRGPAYAMVYVRAGQRVTLQLPNNVPYKITAIAGRQWKGPDELFGTSATTVDFGQTMLSTGNPQVIAMGAPDQTANVVNNNRF